MLQRFICGVARLASPVDGEVAFRDGAEPDFVVTSPFSDEVTPVLLKCFNQSTVEACHSSRGGRNSHAETLIRHQMDGHFGQIRIKPV